MTTHRAPHLVLPRQIAGSSSLEVLSAKTRSLVFATILSGGPMSRTQVARHTGLSPSTVTKVVTPLVAADYLQEVGQARAEKGSGRPQQLLAVNGARHVVVGLKLHPQLVTGVLTDMGAQVIARAQRRLRTNRVDRTLAAAADVVQELLAAREGEGPSPLGLGIALGGHVDSRTGRLVHSGVLGWDDADIAGPLADATGLSIVVNNDLNALAVAERWFGRGRDVESFAVVSTGVGVGCGLVLGGELFTGRTGLAGELGHLPLNPDGPVCSCGNRGCLEAICSAEGILRTVAAQGGPACASLDDAAALAREDRGTAGVAARQAFAVAGEALGRGLAVLCNLLNLERIILSGEGVATHDLFGPALDASWRAHAFSTAATDCQLVADAVDDDLWARGAACLVINEALQAVDVVDADVPSAGQLA
ncbi:N-acetylglucosamine repressor [Baekduia alba]|uniref:ROK family transcriptional regulator n=1 Tax=Baekduia alba TaxID=2997333 RepID=UPI0023403EA0|nr:ROK family transcriptional regulator [Baekduia alba]WCB91827.1 N-acetylglucosamine repressor [Baekduia alba]